MIQIELKKRTPEEQSQKMMEAYIKAMGEKAIIEHKPVPKILEEIASEICEHYCKYPDIWDEEKEGCDLSESEFCQECPLSRLT